ncbi:ROK family protein [Streptomyces sp. NPDC091268]|uniref:ROK family protein n=1 Tax=Streptomyces sp. NPDC091268 TaxID=3365979 RepID=UPI0038157206
MPEEDVFLAVDAGKTKFLVGAFTPSMKEVERHRIAVTGAAETVAALESRIASLFERHSVAGIGLSVFGPLETDPGRAAFGAIVGSSEIQWSGVNLPALLSRRFRVPVSFDFDVAAAVKAEARHVRTIPGRGSEGFTYLSIGTGIGGAHCPPPQSPGTSPGIRTEPPQLGHIPLPRESDDPYPGSCRFHGGCFQGLASGRAIFGRWQVPANELPATHGAWDLQARYIARACAVLVYSSPFTTVRVGSGISQVPGLIARSNDYLRTFMNGFPETLCRETSGSDVIQRAVTAPDSSLIGAALQIAEGSGREFPPRR